MFFWGSAHTRHAIGQIAEPHKKVKEIRGRTRRGIAFARLFEAVKTQPGFFPRLAMGRLLRGFTGIDQARMKKRLGIWKSLQDDFLKTRTGAAKTNRANVAPAVDRPTPVSCFCSINRKDCAKAAPNVM